MPSAKEPDLLQILPLHFVETFLYWWFNWSPQFKPFSVEWINLWGAMTLKPSWNHDDDFFYPGALLRYLKFQERDGIHSLERLASKGVDPNFIMPLLVTYLWNDNVPQTRRQDSIIKDLQEAQYAIATVGNYYKRHFELPAKMLADRREKRRNIQRMIEIHGGAPDEGFTRILSIMGEKVKAQLALIDGISPRPGKAASDKANRTVFTIYQHILKSTGSPQWEDFWNLLVAAGVLPGGGSQTAKDRQIKPRIKSFERYHPTEAKAIIERIIS